jgi:hypothetical protein
LHGLLKKNMRANNAAGGVITYSKKLSNEKEPTEEKNG